MKRLLLKMKLSLWGFLIAATLFAVRFFWFWYFFVSPNGYFSKYLPLPSRCVVWTDVLVWPFSWPFALRAPSLRSGGCRKRLSVVVLLRGRWTCSLTHTHTHIDLEWMHRGRLFRASRLATNCMIMQSKEGSPWTRLRLLADSFLVGEGLNPF